MVLGSTGEMAATIIYSQDLRPLYQITNGSNVMVLPALIVALAVGARRFLRCRASRREIVEGSHATIAPVSTSISSRAQVGANDY